MSASILVLSACSGTKAVDPVITCEEIDESSRTDLLDRYPEAAMPAESLYTGDEHRHIKTAVERFEEIADVDWRILSAGFGLVHSDTEIPSYECTFKDDDSVRSRVERLGYDPAAMTRAKRIRAVADELAIGTDIEARMADEFDVAFVLLGRDYLLATRTALSSVPEETIAFAFAAEGNRSLIGDCEWVPSTETERAVLGTTWTQVKGCQLRNVANNTIGIDHLTDLTSETVRELSVQRPMAG